MKNIRRFAGWLLLWACVAGYVIYAALSAHRARESKVVKAVKITIEDSTAQRRLVTSQQVSEWIGRAGIATIGVGVDTIDLRGIERVVAANGFVDRAVASTSYDGTLRISLSSHTPVLRLLVAGYDHYVTGEGYIFSTPELSSLYLPVITGTYRPPFAVRYEGVLRDDIDRRLKLLDRCKDSLERAKYPYMKLRRDYRDSLRRARYSRFKVKWYSFPSEKEREILKESFVAEREKMIRRYTYLRRINQDCIDALAARQEDVEKEQKKLEKNYEDFMKLLTFVEWVEDDDFWRQEVVQIVVRTADSGELELDLIPRSGDFVVRYGRLERIEEKFDRLKRFYREALSVVGWDLYREIDIRYDGQVVCRK